MITQEQLEAKIKKLFPIEFDPKVESLKDHPSDLELHTLSDENVFALLAWEMWKDGMDWDTGIPDIAEGKSYTREDAITTLIYVYSYGN